MPGNEVSRREFVASAGAAAASLALPGKPAPLQRPKRVLRIAHITDVHVQPERGAMKGFELCLERAQAENPDFIMFGGDMVMDALNVDRDRVMAQWASYQAVARHNVGVPTRHCLGNHDVWGWDNHGKYGRESGFGKRIALDQMGLSSPYYSFDQRGWRFIVLDSIYPKYGNGYQGRIDDGQFEWLSGVLQSTPKKTPILVVSHIPIIAACAYFDGPNERSGNWHVPGAWMHVDARRLKDLFGRYPNVNACISGHIHLVDRVTYNNVDYYCNGAVCAAWWRGNYQECKNGFGIVDLYSNGTCQNRYVEFPWQAQD